MLREKGDNGWSRKIIEFNAEHAESLRENLEGSAMALAFSLRIAPFAFDRHFRIVLRRDVKMELRVVK